MSLHPRFPAPYHNDKNCRPYFEGWYFKQACGSSCFSVIPGVYKGRGAGGDIAFIQVIFSSPPRSFFVRYPISEFRFRPGRFEIYIGKSFFSMDTVRLDIESLSLYGELFYTGHAPLETSLLCPSIMGPFAYVPAMQCHHGVLSLTHRVNGLLRYGDTEMAFKDADGYIEKDWGSSFPESWVWMQCNHEDTSFMCSVAAIPFCGFSFTGLICVLLAGGKQYRFATYNGAKLLSFTADDRRAEAEITRGHYRFHISAQGGAFGTLKAPTKTGMDRDIAESIGAEYDITLRHHCETIFSGSFINGGLEMSNAAALVETPISGSH